MSGSLLDSIRGPRDVQALPAESLAALAADLRAELLQIVSRQGGHLASNLGIVELTIALVRCLDLEQDAVVWDTGHSGYVYKLLTGRRDLMQRLRADGGCCGFLNRDESPYDSFGVGHAGTAISAALGIAAARDRTGEPGRVVAVVGDGALGCGSSLEGLNSIVETTRNFILVVNDNRMSIAPNVGALSRYLARVIPDERYNQFRQAVSSSIKRIPRVGGRLGRLARRVEEAAKSVIVPGAVFEELGLRYIGPLDGHDLNSLCATFAAVRRMAEPVVVHVLTEKGRGYDHAERSPEAFHGVGRFEIASGKSAEAAAPAAAGPTFSAALGDWLYAAARRDGRVMAITAGMCHGTGLARCREHLPRQFFDVGIAEEHAVIFSAGMATRGLRPVVVIYASFMQRAVDYVLHDVCLQRLPVIFCLDRAGVVPDGPTHHGIHDLAFWQSLPHLAVLQPADAAELHAMLDLCLERGEPVVVRYPRQVAAALLPEGAPRAPVAWGRAEVLRPGADVALWGLGREAATALAVAEALQAHGLDAAVVNPRFVNPLDRELLRQQCQAGMPIVTLEDHVVEGGFGTLVRAALADCGPARILSLGWPREILPWGTEDGIRRQYRLDTAALVDDIRAFVRGHAATAP
ncbi:MAG: 1-deoxy-D-xylulose-5-phosphate synthase [Lentisphaerae bacterium]|nr:1-deoxy-D-xylulose-5-phosphate synthase [Lentisphaerota bacterium]